MGMRILICGLNGAGKSTLGRALAARLGIHFIDNEDLYFPKTDARYTYANPRSRDEVKALLLREIGAHEDFVFASVKGDYGEDVYSLFNYAILIEVAKDVRMRRVRERSFEKFGARMLPGGDLCAREESFFAFVGGRAESTVEDWAQCLSCPIIRIDGTRPIEESIAHVLEMIRR